MFLELSLAFLFFCLIFSGPLPPLVVFAVCLGVPFEKVCVCCIRAMEMWRITNAPFSRRESEKIRFYR